MEGVQHLTNVQLDSMKSTLTCPQMNTLGGKPQKLVRLPSLEFNFFYSFFS